MHSVRVLMTFLGLSFAILGFSSAHAEDSKCIHVKTISFTSSRGLWIYGTCADQTKCSSINVYREIYEKSYEQVLDFAKTSLSGKVLFCVSGELDALPSLQANEARK